MPVPQVDFVVFTGTAWAMTTMPRKLREHRKQDSEQGSGQGSRGFFWGEGDHLQWTMDRLGCRPRATQMQGDSQARMCPKHAWGSTGPELTIQQQCIHRPPLILLFSKWETICFLWQEDSWGFKTGECAGEARRYLEAVPRTQEKWCINDLER